MKIKSPQYYTKEYKIAKCKLAEYYISQGIPKLEAYRKVGHTPRVMLHWAKALKEEGYKFDDWVVDKKNRMPIEEKLRICKEVDKILKQGLSKQSTYLTYNIHPNVLEQWFHIFQEQGHVFKNWELAKKKEYSHDAKVNLCALADSLLGQGCSKGEIYAKVECSPTTLLKWFHDLANQGYVFEHWVVPIKKQLSRTEKLNIVSAVYTLIANGASSEEAYATYNVTFKELLDWQNEVDYEEPALRV